MSEEMPKWYENHYNLLKLGRVLVDDGLDAEELLYFFEKPHKWTDRWCEVIESEIKYVS